MVFVLWQLDEDRVRMREREEAVWKTVWMIFFIRAFGAMRVQLAALMEANRERLSQPSATAASDFRFVHPEAALVTQFI